MKILQVLDHNGDSLVVKDMQKMQSREQHDAVTAIVKMVEDLKVHGPESRYIKALTNLPIFELKPRSRGGIKGGVRVYFYWHKGDVVLCRAEVKKGNKANLELIRKTLEYYWEAKNENS